MPTPSPIITPIVVAKSGMVNTLLSRVSATEPAAMPASAVPIGRPVASTEPNARVRMITAKPRPSSSDDGASNEENACPPYSMLAPWMVGATSLIVDDMSLRSFCVASPGKATEA